MRVLWFIAAGSAALLAAALTIPGLRDLVLLGGPCLAASIILIFQGYFLGSGGLSGRIRGAKSDPAWIVVDGSNVMHWNENVPSLQTLRWVLEELSQRGFSPGVIFDANAGYNVTGRYLEDAILAKELRLPEAQVLVVPKGTPADEYILTVARKLGARIVTNDRFRDWAEQFPEVHDPDFLVRGGVRAGHVWLDESARLAQQGA